MDELRKAAGTAVDVWDDTGTRHEDVVNAMNDLRKVLAKNANAAPEFSVGVDTGSADGTSVVVAQKMPDGAIKIIHSQYYPAPQDQDAKDAPDAWTSVKAAMPQSGVTVLAYYKNRNGFERRIRAKWTAAKTVEANAEYGWGEYDEAADAYWTPEGWYECIDNWDEYSSVMVSEGEVTHWMPLPPAPQDQDAKMDEIRKTLKLGMNIGKALREGINEDIAKDAARYRWLRDNESIVFWETFTYNVTKEETDAFIDAAMKGKP